MRMHMSVHNVFVSQVERRKLHNAIVELRGNIRVMCRVRPMNERESDEGSNVVQAVTGDREEKQTKQTIFAHGSQAAAMWSAHFVDGAVSS